MRPAGDPAEAPWRLALVPILHDAEGLSARQAAEAVRSRIDWKYALGLECTDPGFDRTVLSEFRTRFVRGQAESQWVDALWGRGRDRPRLKAHSRQRTDSTPGLGAIRAMNRKRVAGKVQLLYRIAEAVVEAPDGTIRHVLFPCITENTFHELVAEAHASHPPYRIWYQAVMRQKFVRHYRRMLPLVLEHLTFRSENRFQPVIEALAVIKQSLGTKGRYFPADVPVELTFRPLVRTSEAILEGPPAEQGRGAISRLCHVR